MKWICPIEKRYHTKFLDMIRVLYALERYFCHANWAFKKGTVKHSMNGSS